MGEDAVQDSKLVSIFGKTVLLDQTGVEFRFHQKLFRFAAYYGFVPRVCRPSTSRVSGRGISFAWMDRSITRYTPLLERPPPVGGCPRNGCCLLTNCGMGREPPFGTTVSHSKLPLPVDKPKYPQPRVERMARVAPDSPQVLYIFQPTTAS